MGIRIRLDGLGDAVATLAAVAARLDDATPMWDEIGGYLVSSTQQRFELGRDPEGNIWPESWRARTEGGKTLIDSARLEQSITHVATGTGVEVGSNVEYAAAHQFGATIRAKSAKGLRWKYRTAGANSDSWARKMEVTLPRRAFLGVDDQDQEEILLIAASYITAPDTGAGQGGAHAHP